MRRSRGKGRRLSLPASPPSSTLFTFERLAILIFDQSPLLLLSARTPGDHVSWFLFWLHSRSPTSCRFRQNRCSASEDNLFLYCIASRSNLPICLAGLGSGAGAEAESCKSIATELLQMRKTVSHLPNNCASSSRRTTTVSGCRPHLPRPRSPKIHTGNERRQSQPLGSNRNIAAVLTYLFLGMRRVTTFVPVTKISKRRQRHVRPLRPLESATPSQLKYPRSGYHLVNVSKPARSWSTVLALSKEPATSMAKSALAPLCRG